MTVNLALLIYAVVFILLQFGMHIVLRNEATAHGQAVGRQMGCIIGLLWPIALLYFMVVGIVLGARWLWLKGRCE